MATHNIFYVFSSIFMSIFACFCFLFAGCTPNYQYSDICTTNFSTAISFSEPNCEQIILNAENLSQIENIILKDNIIYLNNENLVNYVIQDLNNFCFVFNNDAVVTVSTPIRSIYSTIFASTAQNLYINLNSSITSGALNIKEDLLDTSATIIANNLTFCGEIGNITSNINNALNAKIVNFYSKLNINAQQIAVNCEDCNVYGENLDITAKNAIVSTNTSFLGGTTNINSNEYAIQSQNVLIKNGVLKIDSLRAINCSNFSLQNGLLTIFADTGINSLICEILGGYCYINCKTNCVKALNNLTTNNGITILVTTKQNTSAIDAETATFNALGGTLIANSPYMCAPKSNALLFSTNAGSLLSLKGRTTLTYYTQSSGSLMIAGNTHYSYYSFSGKLLSFENNFFGLLINAQVNTYSSKYINSNYINFGAEVYNNGYISNGQLF